MASEKEKYEREYPGFTQLTLREAAQIIIREYEESDRVIGDRYHMAYSWLRRLMFDETCEPWEFIAPAAYKKWREDTSVPCEHRWVEMVDDASRVKCSLCGKVGEIGEDRW